jgi:hypothetical protein
MVIGLFDMLFRYVGHGVYWVYFHWPFAHRSISSVVVEFACRITSNSSFSFTYCMFVLIASFVPDFFIHVYC